MAQIDREKATKFLDSLKAEVRKTINDHANEASELSLNSADPHLPIVACVQMALASAAFEYLKTCGVPPQEAFQKTLDASVQAVQAWVNALIKVPTSQ